MTQFKKYIVGGFIAALAFFTGSIATFLSITAYEAALFPYNSEGRYFDGMVVHHSGSGMVWGLIAFSVWVITIWLIWTAYWLLKSNKTE